MYKNNKLLFNLSPVASTTKILNNFIILSFPPEASRPIFAAKDKAVTAPVCADRSWAQFRPKKNEKNEENNKKMDSEGLIVSIFVSKKLEASELC